MKTPSQTTIPCRSRHKKYPENGVGKSKGDEKMTVRPERERERERERGGEEEISYVEP